jgi:hypothetical protein
LDGVAGDSGEVEGLMGNGGLGRLERDGLGLAFSSAALLAVSEMTRKSSLVGLAWTKVLSAFRLFFEHKNAIMLTDGSMIYHICKIQIS